MGLAISGSEEPHDRESTPVAEPLPHAPVHEAELLSGEDPEDPSELQRQLEELESELASREEECRRLQKTVEEKDARLDLLDNKIKVMRIEVRMCGS